MTGIYKTIAMLMTLLPPRAGLLAQEKLVFDVASVKQNVSGNQPSYISVSPGPGPLETPSGGTFTARGMPLGVYVMFAYNLTGPEAESLRRQMPAWASEERWDIQAKSDKHDATKDELRSMLRALLVERFKLMVHSMSEQVPVFALVLANPEKLGPGLREHRADDPPCWKAPAPGQEAAPVTTGPAIIAGGFPSICGSGTLVPPNVPGRLAVAGRDVPMSYLGRMLRSYGNLDRPVIDKTGLAGSYDFRVEFSEIFPMGMTPPPDRDGSGPGFQRALLEQLGLKLVQEKAMQERIVLDRIERPSAN